MRNHLLLAPVLALVMLGSVLTTPTLARAPKKYQVTGKVLELTSDLIILDKGGEKWEIARDAGTKVTGQLKVGQRVTIEYRMTATSVEAKDTSKGSGK